MIHYVNFAHALRAMREEARAAGVFILCRAFSLPAVSSLGAAVFALALPCFCSFQTFLSSMIAGRFRRGGARRPSLWKTLSPRPRGSPFRLFVPVPWFFACFPLPLRGASRRRCLCAAEPRAPSLRAVPRPRSPVLSSLFVSFFWLSCFSFSFRGFFFLFRPPYNPPCGFSAAFPPLICPKGSYCGCSFPVFFSC